MTSRRIELGERVVIVTGACGGIGRACVLRFSQEARVLAVDIDPGALGALAEELCNAGRDVITLACDLTAVGAAASIAASACEAGQPVALIHTAGMSPAIADAKRIMAVNFEASRRLVETLFEIAGPGFSAVLIASMAPYIVAVDPAAAAQLFTPLDDNFWSRLLPFCPDGRATYALSKRGVISLCAREAPRWGARGARINSISPGIIDTPMARKEFELDGDAMQALVDLCPAGRKGNADEIASAAHFLCSDQAAFISGADLLVDGGVVAALHRASMA